MVRPGRVPPGLKPGTVSFLGTMRDCIQSLRCTHAWSVTAVPSLLLLLLLLLLPCNRTDEAAERHVGLFRRSTTRPKGDRVVAWPSSSSLSPL